MRDALPSAPRKIENAVVNLDSRHGVGSHWVAYAKNGNAVEYFDSFGNLKPPLELVEYLKNCKITYNRDTYQNYNTSNCGTLCLKFLINYK